MLMDGLIGVLGYLCLVLTVLPWAPCKAWWVRVWDFPRVQITVLAAMVAAARIAGGLQDWWDTSLLVVLAACIVYQLIFILPFTRLWRPEAVSAEDDGHERRRLSILVVNVLMTNRRADGLMESLKRWSPDVILALETDGWWAETLNNALPEHRYRILKPRDNTYGLAFYSRLELVEPECRFLLSEEIPSIRTGIRLPEGRQIRFYGLHPEPPSPTEADSSLPRDAELILIGREASKEPLPVIVAGDLNDVAWSHTSRLFRRISGLLDPRIGRGRYSTFHASYPLLRWPLDHIFYSPSFRLHEIRRLPGFGSDHFPILIVLELAPEVRDEQQPDPASGKDRKEAAQTVEEAAEELLPRK